MRHLNFTGYFLSFVLLRWVLDFSIGLLVSSTHRAICGAGLRLYVRIAGPLWDEPPAVGKVKTDVGLSIDNDETVVDVGREM